MGGGLLRRPDISGPGSKAEEKDHAMQAKVKRNM